MVNSRIAIFAGIVAILISYGVWGDEQRRGLTQPTAVISGDKVYAMGEYRAGKQADWPGRLLLQEAPVEGGKVSEYVLPIVASHSLEGGQTRTCWSLAPGGAIWAMVESDDVAKERSYNIVSVDVSVLNAYAVKGSIAPTQSENPAQGIELSEALPMQVQQGLRAKAMLEDQDSNVLWARQGFDIHAVGSDLVVLYLLVDSRMTVWCYSPGGFAGIDGHLAGPYRINGPLMCSKGQWRQLATFDVPFKSQFRVVHNHDRVYLWTTDGSLFECAGLDARKGQTASQEPVISGSQDCYTLDKKAMVRFLGENERRITVRRVADLTDLDMVLEDIDGGKAYVLAGSQLRLIGSRLKAVTLLQPQGTGQGLIADAMDMVKASVAGGKTIGEPNEPNAPPHRRPEPKPVKEEPKKPANTY